MSKFCFLLGIFLTVALSCLSIRADSWALPEKRTVCSDNGKFCLEVIPKKLDSQLSYFKDKVDGKEDAGADNKIKENYCRGVFYSRRPNGSLQKHWKTKLVNEVSPVDVLVSNDGNYVVTFDNWHGVGYGDNAVAIYRASNGSLIRSFGLSDFLTENDINALPTSTSSIWWGGKHRIDSEKAQLVLQVTKGKRTHEKGTEYFEIRADLASGTILDEKRNRLPSLQFIIQPTDVEVAGVAPPASLENPECFQGRTPDAVSSGSLLKQVAKMEIPLYPHAAKAVRATGQVTVQILVTADGGVGCVRAVSGHPLLRASIVASIKKWNFEKAERAYSGFITFEGRYAVVGPDGQILK